MDREPLVPRVFETHISTVVLVGDRALKFPKPIANEFLDQSTPEKRREICERELWLNRRLARFPRHSGDPLGKFRSRLRRRRTPRHHPEHHATIPHARYRARACTKLRARLTACRPPAG